MTVMVTRYKLALGTAVTWIRRAERLVELRIRVLPVFLKTVIFIILYYKTTGVPINIQPSYCPSRFVK